MDFIENASLATLSESDGIVSKAPEIAFGMEFRSEARVLSLEWVESSEGERRLLDSGDISEERPSPSKSASGISDIMAEDDSWKKNTINQQKNNIFFSILLLGKIIFFNKI